MNRTLEPEIMADVEQSLAYASADFSTSNQRFVDHVITKHSKALRHVIDIGCGPCDVMVRLADALPEVRIVAIDGSAEMIKLASRAVSAAHHEDRIKLMQGRIPGLLVPERKFDAVLSKDLLHHLPDPMVLWGEAQRLARPDATICVMDLVRPSTQEDATAIVETVARGEPTILKEDFYNSLCAAFTMEEVVEQLKEANLPLKVSHIGDRHMLIEGVLQ